MRHVLKIVTLVNSMAVVGIGSGVFGAPTLSQGQELEFDKAPSFAQEAILDYGVADPDSVMLHLFEGDASGNGSYDALLVFYYFEQNELMGRAYVFKGSVMRTLRGDPYTRVGPVEIVGTEPRDFAIENGAFLLTTTTYDEPRVIGVSRRNRIAFPE